MLKVLGVVTAALLSPLLIGLLAPVIICLPVFLILSLPILAPILLFEDPAHSSPSRDGDTFDEWEIE